MKFILNASLVLMLFAFRVQAETLSLNPDCDIFVREGAQWKKIKASEVGESAVDAAPNPKNPQFFQFRVGENLYSGKSQCFQAGSSPEDRSPSSGPKPLFFVGAGLGFAAKDSHEVSVAGTTAKAEGAGESRLFLSSEYRHPLSRFFFISSMVDVGSYKSSEDSDPISLLSAQLMPGISFGEGIRPWVGFAAGGTMLSLKGGTSSEGGADFTLPDKTLFALSFSPRAGVSLALSEKLSLDVMAAYHMINNAKWTGTASVSGNSFELTDTFDLKYFIGMARLGFSF